MRDSLRLGPACPVRLRNLGLGLMASLALLVGSLLVMPGCSTWSRVFGAPKTTSPLTGEQVTAATLTSHESIERTNGTLTPEKESQYVAGREALGLEQEQKEEAVRTGVATARLIPFVGPFADLFAPLAFLLFAGKKQA